VNRYVNDVAMTVLPNAPIDDATGLPIPTIAVATNGGVSVIKDDGTVVDIGQRVGTTVDFTEDNNIIIGLDYYGNGYLGPIPSADISDTSYRTDYIWFQPSGGGNITHLGPGASGSEVYVNRKALYSSEGLSFYNADLDGFTTSASAVAYATTSYNTGWMHGDIKGAFLSDTDATNVTGTELWPEGDFADANEWSSAGAEWTISGGTATVSDGDGGYSFLGSSTGTLTNGKKYVLSFTVSNYSGGRLEASQANSSNIQIPFSANGSYTQLITYTGTTGYGLGMYGYGGGTVNFTLDNLFLRELEEEDRSVNNTGLAVFGTVTKSAVATGAELVAYSGWNDVVNNLYQPYNSDLDFGTGDFSIMLWANHPIDANASNHSTYISHTQNGTPPTNGDWIFRTEGSTGNLSFYIRSGGTWYSILYATSVPASTWYHTVAVRRSGTMYLYIDGKEVASGGLNYAANSTNGIRIGVRYGDTNNYSNEDMKGSMSLLRISASAPSAEQIKKIYEDEKVLFQENAACTLYGSSDAVTALAYDEVTERLHVGTSSGRSEFQGLRRINNTTTAVTTAISAYDSFVVEQ
jgi:hypothetical protein